MISAPIRLPMMFVVMLLSSQLAWASSMAPVTSLSAHEAFVRVDMHYLEELDGVMTVEAVRRDHLEDAWSPLPEEYANFGYRPHSYWYRFTIENPQTEAVNQIIEISYPLLDYVDLYQFSGEALVEHTRVGDRLPYDARKIDHPNFLFPVSLEAGERQSFYLRSQTAGSQLVPIKLWQPTDLMIEMSKEDSLHAAYYGIVLVIVIFNLLIYIALRERMYLYYSVTTLMFMLFFALMRAKLYPVIFSSSPAFHHELLLLLPGSCLIFAALFTREFLSIREYSRVLNHFINLIVGICGMCIVGTFFLDSQTSLKLSVLCSVPASFILLLMGPMTALMGNRAGWVYTFAWGTLMFGTTITALSKQGFLPVNFGTEYGMQIGSALEVFIFNAALAYRFYREHEDKVAAQEAQLKENSERREIESQLLKNSMSHPVTLMPNRACFEQQIRQEILTRRNKRLAVCIVEITRYDEISKTIGHQNTDLMICDIAQHYNLLASRLPGVITIQGPSFNAYLCSLENASFGLLLDVDVAQSREKEVRNLIRAMIKPIEFKDMRLELNTIIGVAICPDHGLNASTLMRHAQVTVDSPDALEKRVTFYRPEHDQYNTRRLTMISELKEAIKKDELELFLQPKYDPVSDNVAGVEALVRWHHPRYGTIRPDEFIPVAEQTGIIRQLTRWVISHSLEHQKRLKDQGYDLSMSINLSAANLREDDLIPFLKDVLAEKGTDPETVYLELTETSMMQHPKQAIAKLEKIRALGMKVSIDDFGSGYSSLAYLKTLPANEIKIDRSLVTEIEEEGSNATVVRSAIAMCHELGFTVVAEGVETDQLLNRLTDLNCDLIQGYLITPPLPHDRLVAWLDGQNANRRSVS